VDDYQDAIDFTSSLLSEERDRTSIATNLSIVLEATKELVGDILVVGEGALSRALAMDELLPLFDRCKHLTSPRICDKV